MKGLEDYGRRDKMGRSWIVRIEETDNPREPVKVYYKGYEITLLNNHSPLYLIKMLKNIDKWEDEKR